MAVKVFALTILLVLASTSAFAAPKAKIVKADSKKSGRYWVVSFEVEGSFTEKVENAILSGIPTTFTYYFTLRKVVSNWADERLFSWKVNRTIKFDHLKRKFEVLLDNEGNKAVFTDFAEAKKAMIIFKDAPVVVTATLSTEAEYYLEVKAKLAPVKLPAVINQLFFFASIWDFETPWHRIELGKPGKQNPQQQ